MSLSPVAMTTVAVASSSSSNNRSTDSQVPESRENGGGNGGDEPALPWQRHRQEQQQPEHQNQHQEQQQQHRRFSATSSDQARATVTAAAAAATASGIPGTPSSGLPPPPLSHFFSADSETGEAKVPTAAGAAAAATLPAPVLSILIQRINLQDNDDNAAAAAARHNNNDHHEEEGYNNEQQQHHDHVVVDGDDLVLRETEDHRYHHHSHRGAAAAQGMNNRTMIETMSIIAPYSYVEVEQGGFAMDVVSHGNSNNIGNAAAPVYRYQHQHSPQDWTTGDGGGGGRATTTTKQLPLSMVRLEARPAVLGGGHHKDDQQYSNNMTVDDHPDRRGHVALVAPPPPATLPDHCQKYWHQRHTLFSRFDQGIQLDEEGWFSVTPERIAAHVAAQVPLLVLSDDDVVVDDDDARHDKTVGPGGGSTDEVVSNQHHHQSSIPSCTPKTETNIVVLDAFCGCGGNAIAFAQRPDIALVVCVDLDRHKLCRAAHNAAIYGVPCHKMLFIECNVIFILQYCYRQGQFVLDAPLSNVDEAMAMMAAMPPAVAATERYRGYQIGGLDLLPRNIDVIFLDPPWGGVDYNAFGRFGYSLHEHMRIPRRHGHLQEQEKADAFFDSFAPTTDYERKAAFNCTLDDTNCVTGAELLRLAARAARGARVLYDIPRNTNRHSLGTAALEAGYRGNMKLDEHYWNGRLKTVTAYFGRDWRA